METTTITKINGTTIEQIIKDGEIYIPIKPICTAIGVDFSAQLKKLKEDEDLFSTVAFNTTVGADKKQREMVSIPLKYVFGWLFTIHPGNVSPEAKPFVKQYRKKCYDVLWRHFSGESKRRMEENAREIRSLERINRLNEDMENNRQELRREKKILASIRAERLNPQPILDL